MHTQSWDQFVCVVSTVIFINHERYLEPKFFFE